MDFSSLRGCIIVLYVCELDISELISHLELYQYSHLYIRGQAHSRHVTLLPRLNNQLTSRFGRKTAGYPQAQWDPKIPGTSSLFHAAQLHASFDPTSKGTSDQSTSRNMKDSCISAAVPSEPHGGRAQQTNRNNLAHLNCTCIASCGAALAWLAGIHTVGTVA
jgi:hypothetical protein